MPCETRLPCSFPLSTFSPTIPIICIPSPILLHCFNLDINKFPHPPSNPHGWKESKTTPNKMLSPLPTPKPHKTILLTLVTNLQIAQPFKSSHWHYAGPFILQYLNRIQNKFSKITSTFFYRICKNFLLCTEYVKNIPYSFISPVFEVLSSTFQLLHPPCFNNNFHHYNLNSTPLFSDEFWRNI